MSACWRGCDGRADRTAAAARWRSRAQALATACGRRTSPGGEPAPRRAPLGRRAAPLAPLTIPITIAGGQVQPNGEKITAALGQKIVLQVTSDEADEIHAHTGGDGYELEVPGGPAHDG